MTNKTSNRSSTRRKVDTTEFTAFLSTIEIGVKPTLHVNGPQHPSAILTVDLGQPLQAVKLKPEVSQELVSRMRRLTRDVVGKDVPVSIETDNPRGILWASLK